MAYDVEQKAQAIALVRTGTSCAKAASLLGLPERSVQLWLREFRETSAKQDDPLLNDQSLRIAERSGELIEIALEHIAEMDPADTHKALFVLNAVRGTSIDKMISSSRKDKVTVPISITFNTRPAVPDDTDSSDAPDTDTSVTLDAEYRAVTPEHVSATSE